MNGMRSFSRRELRARATSRAVVLIAALALASCGGDVTASSTEPAVSLMRLTVDNTQLNVDQFGASTGGPVVLHAGIAARITTEFLTKTGEPDTHVTAASYQVNVEIPSGSAFTFTRSSTDPFAGTIQCNVPNVVGHLKFSLYNTEKKTDYWGPFDVVITVSN